MFRRHTSRPRSASSLTCGLAWTRIHSGDEADEPTGGSHGDRSSRWQFAAGSRRRLGSRRLLEERVDPDDPTPRFTKAAVVTGLGNPTAMEFAPDGRLFVLRTAGGATARPRRQHDPGLPSTSACGLAGRGLLGVRSTPRLRRTISSTSITNPGPGAASWATSEHSRLNRRFTVDDTDPTRPIFEDEAPILVGQPERPPTTTAARPLRHRRHIRRCRRQRTNLHTGGNTYRVSQTLSKSP